MIQASALAGEPGRAGEEGRHMVAKAGRAWAPLIMIGVALGPTRRLAVAFGEGCDVDVSSGFRPRLDRGVGQILAYRLAALGRGARGAAIAVLRRRACAGSLGSRPCGRGTASTWPALAFEIKLGGRNTGDRNHCDVARDQFLDRGDRLAVFGRSESERAAFASGENALKAMIVKVSLMPGRVWTRSVTKWPISAVSGR